MNDPTRDDEKVPDGWLVSGWSRREGAIELTVHRHDMDEDQERMLALMSPELRSQLEADFAARRFTWHLHAVGISLSGAEPTLEQACTAADTEARELTDSPSRKGLDS